MPVVELSTVAIEPVSVDEVKVHCRIDGTAEDSYIRDFLIPTARRQCEAFARQVFVKRSFRQDIEGRCWPSYGQYGIGPIVLDRAPLESITSVAYYASGSTTTTTWSSTNYLADTATIPGRMYLAPGSSWPATSDTRHNAVQVTYVAGHSSTAEGVPTDYRHAVLLMCADLYENRQTEITGTIVGPFTITARELLRPTRNFTFR
jgi:uncharacterized phiE125 gp8 family phage protein